MSSLTKDLWITDCLLKLKYDKLVMKRVENGLVFCFFVMIVDFQDFKTVTEIIDRGNNNVDVRSLRVSDNRFIFGAQSGTCTLSLENFESLRMIFDLVKQKSIILTNVYLCKKLMDVNFFFFKLSNMFRNYYKIQYFSCNLNRVCLFYYHKFLYFFLSIFYKLRHSLFIYNFVGGQRYLE